MDILDEKTWLDRLRRRENPARTTYRAMYSTWWDGIVTDPSLMIVPVDDHQVHRGDAVFEALKAVDGRIWLGKPHLDRLEASAEALGLASPLSRPRLEDVLRETLKVSGLRDAILRLFLTRGPGHFSTNPYDSVGPQINLIVTDLKPLPESKILEGVSIGLSRIPVKDPWMARIKSCNYLANVLMKKEAVDRGLDFTIGLDAGGVLTEGSTENLMLVDAEGWLVRPRPEGILAGTTMLRACELAEPLVAEGLLSGVCVRDLTLTDLENAREVLMAGTTLDVVAVTRLEEKRIGSGLPGPVGKRLKAILNRDQEINPGL